MLSSALTPSGTTCKEPAAFLSGRGVRESLRLWNTHLSQQGMSWGTNSELSKRGLAWSREDLFFKSEL